MTSCSAKKNYILKVTSKPSIRKIRFLRKLVQSCTVWWLKFFSAWNFVFKEISPKILISVLALSSEIPNISLILVLFLIMLNLYNKW